MSTRIVEAKHIQLENSYKLKLYSNRYIKFKQNSNMMAEAWRKGGMHNFLFLSTEVFTMEWKSKRRQGDASGGQKRVKRETLGRRRRRGRRGGWRRGYEVVCRGSTRRAEKVVGRRAAGEGEESTAREGELLATARRCVAKARRCVVTTPVEEP